MSIIPMEDIMKKWTAYEYFVILCFCVVPIISIALESLLISTETTMSELALKWFVFGSIGLRLGIAGMKQLVHPQFTAKEIFNILDDAANPLVKELGSANICFSLLAIVSLWVTSFRIPAALAGGLYFGFAGFMHLLKPRESDKETFAMISDLFIFFVLIILIIMNVT